MLKREHAYRADGNVNEYSHYGKKIATKVPKKLRIELSYYPGISLLGIYPKFWKHLLVKIMAWLLYVSHWSSLSFMAADLKKLDDTGKWNLSAFHRGIYVFIQHLWSCINAVLLWPAVLSEWWWYITPPNVLRFIKDFSYKQTSGRIFYWGSMQRVSFIPHHYLKIIIIYIFQLRKPRLSELQQLVQTTWLINGKFN